MYDFYHSDMTEYFVRAHTHTHTPLYLHTPTYTYTFALFLVFPPYPLHSLIFLVCSYFVVPHLRFKFSLDLKNLTGHFFLVLSNNSSFLDLT